MADASGTNSKFDELPKLPTETLVWRKEVVFLILSGIFLGSLAMLNIIGVARFLDLSFDVPLLGWHVPMEVAVGVLPYPITFLCTDLICELYGRKRANSLVAVGFLINCWVAFILWIGGILPGTESPEFFLIRQLTLTTVLASMVAYAVAQLVDVQLFHFWKKLTRGKHLWLRNNGSTLVSQLVDTTAIILIIYPIGVLPIDEAKAVAPQLLVLIASGYVFKLVAALVDTGPLYLLVGYLRRYLRLPSAEEEFENR